MVIYDVVLLYAEEAMTGYQDMYLQDQERYTKLHCFRQSGRKVNCNDLAMAYCITYALRPYFK